MNFESQQLKGTLADSFISHHKTSQIVTESQMHPVKGKKSKVSKYLMFGVLILLGLSFLLVLTLGMIQSDSPNLSSDSSDYQTEQTVHLQHSNFFTVNGYRQLLTLQSTLATQVYDLKIVDCQIEQLYISNFPNLRSLTIMSKVQKLVVNNTKLVQFAQNSTVLKELIFVNNPSLVRFINSRLTVLTSLNISSTPITEWKNNKFGSLNYLEFRDSSIKDLPLVDDNVKNIVISNCQQVRLGNTIDENFPFFKNLISVKIENTNFNILYFKNSKLTSINIFNATMQSLNVVECSVLQNFSFDRSQSYSMDFDSLPRLTQSVLIITNTIQRMHLKDAVFSGLFISANRFNYLYLQGNIIPKIKLTDTNVLQLVISSTTITTDQFNQLISYQSLQSLTLNKCTNLKYLSGIFPHLTQIITYSMKIEFAQKISIPKINKVLMTSTTLTNYLTFFNTTLQIFNFQMSSSTIHPIILPDSLKQLSILNSNVSELIIYGQNVQTIYIENSNLEQFQYYNFTRIKTFVLKGNPLKSVSYNDFGENLQTLIIDGTNQSVYFDFESNSLFNIVTERPRMFKLSNANIYKYYQYLPNVTQVHLDHNDFVNIHDLFHYFPNARHLDISFSFGITQISDKNHSNIAVLNLSDSQHMLEFTNNTLYSLQWLTLNGCQNLASFKNNYLPHLFMLEIQNTPNLREDTILTELKKLKDNQTHLQFMRISNPTLQFQNKIKQIFPSIIINQ